MSSTVGIISIIYGGKEVKDNKVAAAIAKAADDGSEFAVENDNVGGDPWYGVQKSFTVVYHKTFGGIQILNAREHDKVKF